MSDSTQSFYNSQMCLMLPLLLLSKVLMSLQPNFSSTNCYFIAEDRNADHCLFPKWEKTIVVSVQTSSPPPHLPTSSTLPTIFSAEQFLMASVLTKHLSFPFFLRTIRQVSKSHTPFCCCTYNPSVYMQFFSLSTMWERQPGLGILILLCYHSNIVLQVQKTVQRKRISGVSLGLESLHTHKAQVRPSTQVSQQ